MGGARELIDKYQLSVSASVEMDTKQRRDHYLEFVVRLRDTELEKRMETPKHLVHF